MFYLRFCVLAATAGAKASKLGMSFQGLYDLSWSAWPWILLHGCPSAAGEPRPGHMVSEVPPVQLRVSPLPPTALSSLLHVFIHFPGCCRHESLQALDAFLMVDSVVDSEKLPKGHKNMGRSCLLLLCLTVAVAPTWQAFLRTQPWFYNVFQVWVDLTRQAHHGWVWAQASLMVWELFRSSGGSLDKTE